MTSIKNTLRSISSNSSNSDMQILIDHLIDKFATAQDGLGDQEKIDKVSTKDFFILLNSYFIQSKYRLQVLTILGEFIRRQELHIHQILETPLFDSLLTSLQLDTSTTVISLSLTTLIMLLPHICTSVINYLPQLYIVFIRILCWDKRDIRSNNFDSSFENAPTDQPNCQHLFTFLYGMFPCNTVKFLKDPTGWIKEMNHVPIVEGIDDDVIRARSLPLLQRHTVHPNLILSDCKKELSDTSRWMKLEPADVVVESVGFNVENSTKQYADKIENITKKILEESNNSITNETEKSEGTRKRSSYTISVKEIMKVHEALKSGADIVVGDDPWTSKIISYSNSLSQSADNNNVISPLNSTTTILSNVDSSVAFLQREIMLLRNELNFELYLKQQHLQHIGRLHRDHILDNMAEAEKQNLYNTCKALKSQLKKVQAEFDRQRTETANLKKTKVQWENELNTKLKNYREEKKDWKLQMDKALQELNEAKLTASTQNKRIEEIGAKNFSMENKLKLIEPELVKLTEYQEIIDRLKDQLMLWELDTKKFEKQKKDLEILVTEWHKMEMLSRSKDQEIEQLKVSVGHQSQLINELRMECKMDANDSQNNQKTAFEKQKEIWIFERDKKLEEYKKLEANYEQLKKSNEELKSEILELLAKIEFLTPREQI